MLIEMTGSVLGVVIVGTSSETSIFAVVGSLVSWGAETMGGVDTGEMTTGDVSFICLESGLGLLMVILRRFGCKLCGDGVVVAGGICVFTTRVDFRLRWIGGFLRRILGS